MIIALDALPMTHNGKPSESAARNAVNNLPVGNVSALCNPESLDAIRTQVALNTASSLLPAVGEALENLERYLMALWEHLFCFGPIGRDDNFFDLGGDSLLATELAMHVQRTTGRTIPLTALMIAPTIARLATLIKEDTLPAASSRLAPMRAGEGRPLFWLHSVTGSVIEMPAACRSAAQSAPDSRGAGARHQRR